MKAFLEYVAADMLNKLGTDLSRVAVVFPNKRASLFLNEHLAQKAGGKPIWSPAYTTISDLFRQHTQRQVADTVKLVCDLHKSFIAQTGIDETLDHFYGWGQLLLADFDDIDKQMANADKVFANLADLHEMDDDSFLNDEQREVLRRFFSNFSDDHNSELKQRFLRLWSRMGNIYHDFNKRLKAQGLAYEGALYKDVVSQEEIIFQYDTYVFVGFNVLLNVEQRLFSLIQRQGKARFYWDFDHYYMKNHEAGHFIGQYLADFPNELDNQQADIYQNFSKPKHISIASASTENIQARYTSQWLREGERISSGRQTAVVLCNEGLLPTIIHCLPHEVEHVNITTGYPLAQSPVTSLVNALIALRREGYDQQRARFRQRQRTALLRHPYLQNLSTEVEELLFKPFSAQHQNEEILAWLCDVTKAIAKNPATDILREESIFRVYTLLNRLLNLARSGDLQTDIVTLGRLVNQLLQATSVPFHGEPIEGIQVMGLLETRNLDFKHLLILSAQEGNMPRGAADTSFIPYSLRRAYGLTTPDHKVAIYSYYFHRLLQRADDITIIYNNATTDGQKGEMSRFLLQLMAEGKHPLELLTLQGTQDYAPRRPQPVENHAQMPQLLTPTAINRYLRCPLQFHYRYVCHLEEPNDTDEDTIDNRIFGNIFHQASQTVYTRLIDSKGGWEQQPQILATDLSKLLKNGVEIEQAVDEAFSQELFHQPIRHLKLGGMQLISRQVIIHYLRQLLANDKLLTPFTIVDLEGEVSMDLPVNIGGQTQHVRIGGRIDRLDMVTTPEGKNQLRVIDYKTGAHRMKGLSGVEAVFSQNNLKEHSDYYLQAMLYAIIVARQQPRIPVAPALLFIQHAGAENYDPILCFGKEPINDVSQHAATFLELLAKTIGQMFDPNIPLLPTDDSQRCRTCPYRQLCY